MRIQESVAALRSYCRQRTGLDVEQLDATQAVDLVTSWYETERADDANSIEEQGDMLLFQWDGPWQSQDPTFGYDLTRQFIEPSEPDDADSAIWQLSVTLHFARDESTESPRGGNLWCKHPRDLPHFVRQVTESEAARSVSGRRPLRVVVDLGPAG